MYKALFPHSVAAFITIVALAACSSPAEPTATLQAIQVAPSLESIETETLMAVETATLKPTPEPVGYFNIAIIVDTTSEPVSQAEVDAVMADANAILYRITKFGLTLTDFVEDASGSSVDVVTQNYMNTHSDNLPNGIIIFSFGDGDQAKLYGGYAREITAPSGFVNTFNSPLYGTDQMYVAVIHFRHHYAACGYAGTDTIQSAVSSNGECRGQDGLACVEHNGYQICENAVENLYASTASYFTAATLVHEIMHSFAEAGTDAHWGTAACKTAMGWPQDYFDFDQAERYNVMCPYVYDNFVNSYQP